MREFQLHDFRESLLLPTARPLARAWFASGAMMGLAAVASAALAAHLPDRMLHAGGREALRAAVQMLGWHAAALLASALWLRHSGLRAAAHLAAACFVIGALCFVAGVATPVLGGPDLGIVAPTGGTLLMLGWALLAISTLRQAGP